MHDRRLASFCFCTLFLLLPLLPSCSLVSPRPEALEGFSTESLYQIREDSAELEQLHKLNATTPAVQQRIRRLSDNLQQFESSAIRSAERLEHRGDWLGAEHLLEGAVRILPNSQRLNIAQQQLSERRQVHAERVRMELAIHQGEQLLKDAEAYQRLQQLQGPGVLSWLELKNFNRKRRASAQSLTEYAQLAIQRRNRKDYVLAHRALTVAQGLYGDDLRKPENGELRDAIARDLALTNRKLRPAAKPQPAKTVPQKPEMMPVTDLQQALRSGDLFSARKLLNQIQQQAPQHPQLKPLQSQFETQVKTRIDYAIRRGNALYSQGEINQALSVWREARILAPDNVELQANIARAEKLLENLKVLSTP